MGWNSEIEFSMLKGKILKEVIVEADEILFIVSDKEKYKLHHYQDCCESVTIESIVGDILDLVGSEITMAEESCNDISDLPNEEDFAESFTWTFYKLATTKGYVDIRWYGISNGYYSESVDFCKVT